MKENKDYLYNKSDTGNYYICITSLFMCVKLFQFYENIFIFVSFNHSNERYQMHNEIR